MKKKSSHSKKSKIAKKGYKTNNLQSNILSRASLSMESNKVGNVSTVKDTLLNKGSKSSSTQNVPGLSQKNSRQTYMPKSIQKKLAQMDTFTKFDFLEGACQKIDNLPKPSRHLMSLEEFKVYSENQNFPNPDLELAALLCDKPELGLAAPSTFFLSLDCEMVGVLGNYSSLARISIVDYFGSTLYDTFVCPNDKVTDYRTWISGITPEHLIGAPSLMEVQKKVKSIIIGKTLITHTSKADLQALNLGKNTVKILDISKAHKWAGVGNKNPISLKNLTYNFVGIKIQSASHSSVTDALATMAVFRKLSHYAPKAQYN